MTGAAERPTVSPEQAEAMVAAFAAVEEHVADCPACRSVEDAFNAAMERSMEEAAVVSREFCAENRRLTEELATVMQEALGADLSPDVAGQVLGELILERLLLERLLLEREP